jgi:L,D-transpeptidase catalytic domain
VPPEVRAHELESSAKRIADLKIQFDQPYVVVNIPAASVEAIENQRVLQRHTAIAGKRDHRSPQLTAAIQGINPTWTIPHAIVESELIPKLKKDPHYLSRAKLVVLDRNGRKVRHIQWSRAASLLTFRQDRAARILWAKSASTCRTATQFICTIRRCIGFSPTTIASSHMDACVSMASMILPAGCWPAPTLKETGLRRPLPTQHAAATRRKSNFPRLYGCLGLPSRMGEF